MTNVSGIRPGTTSTEVMEEASERAHVLKEGEGRALDWHAGHSSMADGIRAEHERNPSGTLGAAAEAMGFGSIGALVTTVGKTAAKNLPELLTNPKKLITEQVGQPLVEWSSKMSALVQGSRIAAGIGAGALIVGGEALAVADVWHACNKGDEIKKLSDLDAIDVATTALLALDDGFKASDMAKHPSIVPEKLVAFMMTSDFGREHLPALQAEADEGARAAFVALQCGGREAYFNVHPEQANVLATSVAFNKGFESVMWCAAQADGKARLATILAGLDARDPRASSAVTVHG